MAVLVGRRVSRAVGAATLLAVAGFLAMPNLAKAQEETFSQTGTIPDPGLTSFDISYVSPTWNGAGSGQYFLADRSNKQILTYNIATGAIGSIKSQGFVGAVGTPVNNNLSGPNGVLVVNNASPPLAAGLSSGAGFEVWAGDGPQVNAGCPQSFPLSGSCSAVKVTSKAGGNALTHVIPTNGLARADEGCLDPVDGIVLIANDAESAQNPKLGTPFISFISTKTYAIVAQMTFPQASNGIEQCQYDTKAGLFFLNLPEVNGKGDDSSDGNVVAIQAPNAGNSNTPSVVATYIIPTVDCAGPQGMAVGPDPQLLLGCNALGPNGVQNSLVINKYTGAVIAIGWGIGGADEAWFNPGDSHYYVTGSSLPAPQLAVVDAFSTVDQIIATPKQAGASPHSVAADSNTNIFFVPNGGGVAVFAPSPAAEDSDDPNIKATWTGVNE